MNLFSLKSVNSAIKILLVLLLTINTAAALWSPLLSIFVINNIVGATLVTIGVTGALYSVVKSLLQIPIAKYLDARAGEKDDFIVIFTGIFLAGMASFAFLFIGKAWELALVQVLWGIADACTMAAYYAIFSHHIDKKSAAFEWSLFSVGGMTVAIAVGGLIGSLLIQSFGFTLVFVLAGIMNLLALALLGFFYPYIKVMRKKEVQP